MSYTHGTRMAHGAQANWIPRERDSLLKGGRGCQLPGNKPREGRWWGRGTKWRLSFERRRSVLNSMGQGVEEQWSHVNGGVDISVPRFSMSTAIVVRTLQSSMVAMMARDLRRLEGDLRRLEEDLRRSRMIRGLEWSHLVVTRPKTGCSQSSLLSSGKRKGQNKLTHTWTIKLHTWAANVDGWTLHRKMTTAAASSTQSLAQKLPKTSQPIWYRIFSGKPYIIFHCSSPVGQILEITTSPSDNFMTLWQYTTGCKFAFFLFLGDLLILIHISVLFSQKSTWDSQARVDTLSSWATLQLSLIFL